MLIFGIVVAAVAFFLLVPITVHLRYRNEKLAIWAGIFFPLFRVFPFHEKNQKRRTVKKTLDPSGNTPSASEKKNWRSDQKLLLKAIRRFPHEVKRLLVIYKLDLHVRIGNEDPGDLALSYGAAGAALELAEALLSPIFPVARWNVRVAADFEADRITLEGCAHARTSLLRFLFVLISLANRGILFKKNEWNNE